MTVGATWGLMSPEHWYIIRFPCGARVNLSSMFLLCVQSIQGFIVLKKDSGLRESCALLETSFLKLIFIQAENRIHLVRLHFMRREAAVFPWFERDGVSMG